MAVSSSNISFILIVVLNVVQGTLTPNGNVSVDCGRTLIFTCNASGEPLKWTTSGLRGISRGPFLARTEALYNSRMWSPDEGGETQFSVSSITIYGFSISDDGGTIQCINTENKNARGMASISVASLPLPPPTNVTANVESCDVTLQWDQPSEPNDTTASVSCTPPSPGCAECTTSPCTITGLNPSIEYVFTVTLNSGGCRTNMSTTGAKTKDSRSCIPSNSTSNDTSPGDTSLAALVLLVLLIPMIYPLGVLITKVCCFKDKSYCEVFWCCGCYRKDTSAQCNSTELMKSLHPREEMEYQNESKENVCSLYVKEQLEHIPFIIDGEKNKDHSRNEQEHVVNYETAEELVVNDGDVITDETVEQQGYEDWITYADLDFSGHRKENINVGHSIGDKVTYAAVKEQ